MGTASKTKWWQSLTPNQPVATGAQPATGKVAWYSSLAPGAQTQNDTMLAQLPMDNVAPASNAIPPQQWMVKQGPNGWIVTPSTPLQNLVQPAAGVVPPTDQNYITTGSGKAQQVQPVQSATAPQQEAPYNNGWVPDPAAAFKNIGSSWDAWWQGVGDVFDPAAKEKRLEGLTPQARAKADTPLLERGVNLAMSLPMAVQLSLMPRNLMPLLQAGVKPIEMLGGYAMSGGNIVRAMSPENIGTQLKYGVNAGDLRSGKMTPEERAIQSSVGIGLQFRRYLGEDRTAKYGDILSDVGQWGSDLNFAMSGDPVFMEQKSVNRALPHATQIAASLPDAMNKALLRIEAGESPEAVKDGIIMPPTNAPEDVRTAFSTHAQEAAQSAYDIARFKALQNGVEPTQAGIVATQARDEMLQTINQLGMIPGESLPLNELIFQLAAGFMRVPGGKAGVTVPLDPMARIPLDKVFGVNMPSTVLKAGEKLGAEMGPTAPGLRATIRYGVGANIGKLREKIGSLPIGGKLLAEGTEVNPIEIAKRKAEVMDQVVTDMTDANLGMLADSMVRGVPEEVLRAQAKAATSAAEPKASVFKKAISGAYERYVKGLERTPLSQANVLKNTAHDVLGTIMTDMTDAVSIKARINRFVHAPETLQSELGYMPQTFKSAVARRVMSAIEEPLGKMLDREGYDPSTFGIKADALIRRASNEIAQVPANLSNSAKFFGNVRAMMGELYLRNLGYIARNTFSDYNIMLTDGLMTGDSMENIHAALGRAGIDEKTILGENAMGDRPSIFSMNPKLGSDGKPLGKSIKVPILGPYQDLMGRLNAGLENARRTRAYFAGFMEGYRTYFNPRVTDETRAALGPGYTQILNALEKGAGGSLNPTELSSVLQTMLDAKHPAQQFFIEQYIKPTDLSYTYIVQLSDTLRRMASGAGGNDPAGKSEIVAFLQAEKLFRESEGRKRMGNLGDVVNPRLTTERFAQDDIDNRHMEMEQATQQLVDSGVMTREQAVHDTTALTDEMQRQNVEIQKGRDAQAKRLGALPENANPLLIERYAELLAHARDYEYNLRENARGVVEDLRKGVMEAKGRGGDPTKLWPEYKRQANAHWTSVTDKIRDKYFEVASIMQGAAENPEAHGERIKALEGFKTLSSHAQEMVDSLRAQLDEKGRTAFDQQLMNKRYQYDVARQDAWRGVIAAAKTHPDSVQHFFDIMIGADHDVMANATRAMGLKESALKVALDDNSTAIWDRYREYANQIWQDHFTFANKRYNDLAARQIAWAEVRHSATGKALSQLGYSEDQIYQFYTDPARASLVLDAIKVRVTPDKLEQFIKDMQAATPAAPVVSPEEAKAPEPPPMLYTEDGVAKPSAPVVMSVAEQVKAGETPSVEDIAAQHGIDAEHANQVLTAATRDYTPAPVPEPVAPKDVTALHDDVNQARQQLQNLKEAGASPEAVKVGEDTLKTSQAALVEGTKVESAKAVQQLVPPTVKPEDRVIITLPDGNTIRGIYHGINDNGSIRFANDADPSAEHSIDAQFVKDMQPASVEQPAPAPLPTMTRDTFRQKLADTWAQQNGTLPTEQVDAVMRMVDARAATWAKWTGRTADEWYASRIADVTNQAPTGKALNQMNYAAQQAPAFKAWFGDSKAVDGDGNPLILYHGTRAGFTEFRAGNGAAGPGIYLSTTPQKANAFAGEDEGSRVMPVYAALKNPLRVPWRDSIDAKAYNERARREGYDGLIIEGQGEMVVFDPAQIKSAIGNRGTFDPNNPNILYQQQPQQPVWYSQLARAIESKMGGSAPIEQVRGIVKGAQIKSDELKWTGFGDWANGLKPGTKVTRDEVLAHIQLPEMKEVTKGSATPLLENAAQSLYHQSYTELTPQEQGRVVANVRRNNPDADVTGASTQYGQYVLPGGENYREMLFTLPERDLQAEKRATLAEGVKIEQAQNALLDKWHKGDPSQQVAYDSNKKRLQEIRSRLDSIDQTPQQKPYQSQHWDESNVLAHTRLTDRTDTEGRKVLMVEEIQSDWHQAGRQKGSYDPKKPFQVFNPKDGATVASFATRPEALAEVARLGDAYDSIDRRAIRGAVPEAPLSKTWHEFVFKRLLRYAADNGYDSLSWTTGAQQSERYNLGDTADSIAYIPAEKTLVAYKDGRVVFTDRNATPDRLPEIIGQDPAKRLLASPAATPAGEIGGNPRQTISGEALSVGGEGMKGFYDKMLVDYANRYGKKWGAKVGGASLNTTQNYDLFESYGRFVIKDANGKVAWEGDSGAEADAKLKSLSTSETVHSMPITEAMKESVMQGQPFFQDQTTAGGVKRGATSFEVDGRAIIRGLTAPDISTAIHEFAHVLRNDLYTSMDEISDPTIREQLRGDITTLESWAGAKGGAWDTAAEEKMARGFEEYTASGKAANPALIRIFEKIKEWMAAIYRGFEDMISGRMTSEVKAVFDRALAEYPALATIGETAKPVQGEVNRPTPEQLIPGLGEVRGQRTEVRPEQNGTPMLQEPAVLEKANTDLQSTLVSEAQPTAQAQPEQPATPLQPAIKQPVTQPTIVRIPAGLRATSAAGEIRTFPNNPYGTEQAQKWAGVKEITAKTAPRRVTFNRGDINSVIQAALRLKSDKDWYIYGTANGFVMAKSPPPATQRYAVVHPDGTTASVEPNFGAPATQPKPPAPASELPANPEGGIWAEVTALVKDKTRLRQQVRDLKNTGATPDAIATAETALKQATKAISDLVKTAPVNSFRELPGVSTMKPTEAAQHFENLPESAGKTSDQLLTEAQGHLQDALRKTEPSVTTDYYPSRATVREWIRWNDPNGAPVLRGGVNWLENGGTKRGARSPSDVEIMQFAEKYPQLNDDQQPGGTAEVWRDLLIKARNYYQRIDNAPKATERNAADKAATAWQKVIDGLTQRIDNEAVARTQVRSAETLSDAKDIVDGWQEQPEYAAMLDEYNRMAAEQGATAVEAVQSSNAPETQWEQRKADPAIAELPFQARMTRAKFEKAMISAFGFTPEQAGINMALADAHASVWAKMNGRTPEEWYDTHIADVTNQAPVGDALYQSGGQSRGAVSSLDDSRAVIHALGAKDLSTAANELGYIFRRDLAPADLAITEDWAGVKGGKWDVPAEEKFARGFEQYLQDGKAPMSGLEKVFTAFKEWLTRIYGRLTGAQVEQIPEQMRGVYDRLLAEQSQIDQYRTEQRVSEMQGRTAQFPERTTPIEPPAAGEQAGLFGEKVGKGQDLLHTYNVLTRELAQETHPEFKVMLEKRIAEVKFQAGQQNIDLTQTPGLGPMFAQDFAGVTQEAPVVQPGVQPVTRSVDITKYINTIKNQSKQVYAEAWQTWIDGGKVAPEPKAPTELGGMGAQAVRLRLAELNKAAQAQPAMQESQVDLLARIDKTIANMRQKAIDSPDYADGYSKGADDLQAKRDAIASGKPYDVVSVGEQLVGGVGRQIATWTKNTQTFDTRKKAEVARTPVQPEAVAPVEVAQPVTPVITPAWPPTLKVGDVVAFKGGQAKVTSVDGAKITLQPSDSRTPVELARGKAIKAISDRTLQAWDEYQNANLPYNQAKVAEIVKTLTPEQRSQFEARIIGTGTIDASRPERFQDMLRFVAQGSDPVLARALFEHVAAEALKSNAMSANDIKAMANMWKMNAPSDRIQPQTQNTQNAPIIKPQETTNVTEPTPTNQPAPEVRTGSETPVGRNRPEDTGTLAGAPADEGKAPKPAGGTVPDSLPSTGKVQGPGGGTGEGGQSTGGSRGNRTGRAATVPDFGAGETGGGTGEPVNPPKALHPKVDAGGYDYVMGTGDELDKGGNVTKFNNNLEAIRLLKQLDKEGRLASPDEQRVIAKFVGWGPVWDYFDPEKTVHKWSGKYDARLAERRAQLEALMTPEEMRTAASVTPNSHYTSANVVTANWNLLRHLGFDGGKTLEPGIGGGRFYGLMPTDIAENSRRVGVDIDNISAAISKQLFQRAQIFNTGYQDAPLPNNYFDLELSNVPFGNYAVADPAFKGKNDFLTKSIHNYYFAKALEHVRPGGLISFITSRYTMDSVDPAVRQYIADRAELVGAIRLPEGAFKASANTDVTTDLIVLRKRLPSETSHDAEKQWVDTTPFTDGLGKTFALNRYFQDNPEMMLGRMEASGTMYGSSEPALKPDGRDINIALDEVIKRFPQNIYAQPEIATPSMSDVIRTNATKKRNGSYTVKDGKVYVRHNNQDAAVAGRDADAARILSLQKVTEEARKVLDVQYSSDDETKLQAAQKQLGSTYDTFAKKYGPINDTANKRAMRGDPSLNFLMGLERLDPVSGKYVKAPFFTQRVGYKQTEITSVPDADTALITSLNQRGKVDIGYMAKLAGKTPEQVVSDLGDKIYQNPSGGYEAPDEYLTGEVRSKLKAAKDAAKIDSAYQRNVDALQRVIPEEVQPADISVRLGAPWVPTKTVTQFMNHIARGRWDVKYIPATADWIVEGGSYDRAALTNKWGTDRVGADSIIRDMLKLKQTKVYDKNPDGSSSLNERDSMAAQGKAEEIQKEFQSWIFSDPQQAQELGSLYNDMFNGTVPRTYSMPEGYRFHGLNPEWESKLRPSQRNVIWRTLQGNNVLMAHEVGAGKTASMIVAGMEMKRLGLRDKPVYVVMNSTLKQFSETFDKLYPGANVLIATPDDLSAANRNQFMTKVATGSYDAIVMPHSSFGLLPVSKDTLKRFIGEQMNDLQTFMDAYSADKSASQLKKDRTFKQAEKRKNDLNAQLQKRLADKNDQVTFEQLGIDQLFVDEAHQFKNLMYLTKMGNDVRGLGNKAGSNRALDMYMKTRFLTERNNGGGVTLATGTPVSNSLSEMYNVMRYLMPTRLKALGIDHFDAWVQSFADPVTEQEPTATGYKDITRLRSFHNMPELMQLFNQVADIQTQKMLNLPRPELETGSPQGVVVPSTPELKAYLNGLADRAKNLRPGEKDNMLVINTDAKKSTLDMRLVDPGAIDNPNSKLNAAVDNVLKVYKQYAPEKGTQVIFSDLSIPSSAKNVSLPKYAAVEGQNGEWVVQGTLIDQNDNPITNTVGRGFNSQKEANAAIKNIRAEARVQAVGFSAYDDIKAKLIQKGVPAKDIAFIHDYKTDDARAEMYDKMNNGDIRILLGSTPLLGTGVNIQERLIAAHHLDVPYRPSDLEQRNGRILRPGNMFAKSGVPVKIFNYITKGEGKMPSFDQVMWNLIESKAKTAGKIMDGEYGRTVTEDNQIALSASAFKALASGDPMVAEQIDITRKLNRLDALAEAHTREQRDARFQTKSLPNTIDSMKSELDKVREVSKQITADTPKQLRAEWGGKVYDRATDKEARTKFSDAIHATIEDASLSQTIPVNIGRMNGADIWVQRTPEGAITATMRASNGAVIGTRILEAGEDNKANVGNISRIEGAFYDYSSRVNQLVYGIDLAENNLKQYSELLNKPFEHQSEYDQMHTRLTEIESKLGKVEADTRSMGSDEDAAKAEAVKYLGGTDVSNKQNNALYQENPAKPGELPQDVIDAEARAVEQTQPAQPWGDIIPMTGAKAGQQPVVPEIARPNLPDEVVRAEAAYNEARQSRKDAKVRIVEAKKSGNATRIHQAVVEEAQIGAREQYLSRQAGDLRKKLGIATPTQRAKAFESVLAPQAPTETTGVTQPTEPTQPTSTRLSSTLQNETATNDGDVHPDTLARYRDAVAEAGIVEAPYFADIQQASTRQEMAALDKIIAGVQEHFDSFRPVNISKGAEKKRGSLLGVVFGEKAPPPGGTANITDEMARQALNMTPEQVKLLQAEIRNWIPQMAEASSKARTYAKARADISLLDYGDKRGFDTDLLALAPFSYWGTRQGRNYALRMMNNPALLLAYLRYKDAMDKENKRRGTRARFTGGINVGKLGGQSDVYIDPLSFIYPFANLVNFNVDSQDVATNGIQQAYQWANNWGLRPSPIFDIPLRLSGALQTPTMDPAEKLRQEATWGPKSLGEQLPRFTAPIQAATAAIGVGGPTGVDIEAPIRRALGLGEGEPWDAYRTSRSVSDMAFEAQNAFKQAGKQWAENDMLPYLAAQELISRYGKEGSWLDFLNTMTADSAAKELQVDAQTAVMALHIAREGALRATQQRGFTQMASFLAGQRALQQPTGEGLRDQAMAAERAARWNPQVQYGSKAQVDQVRAANPALTVSRGQYGSLPGENNDISYLYETTQRNQINGAYDKLKDYFLQTQPWDKKLVRAVEDSRYKALATVRPSTESGAPAAAPEWQAEYQRLMGGLQTGTAPQGTYYPRSILGATPQEQVQFRKDEAMKFIYQTQPQYEDYIDEQGQPDWASYDTAKAAWVKNLPKLATGIPQVTQVLAQAAQDGNGQAVQKYLETLTAQQVYDYRKRYDSPAEAAQRQYFDKVYTPTWDAYRKQVDAGVAKSDAYAATVGSVGAVSAQQLAELVQKEYPGKWTPAQLQQGIGAMQMPDLVTVMRGNMSAAAKDKAGARDEFWAMYNTALPPGKASYTIKQQPLVALALDQDSRSTATAEQYKLAVAQMRGWLVENYNGQIDPAWGQARQQKMLLDQLITSRFGQDGVTLLTQYTMAPNAATKSALRLQYPVIDQVLAARAAFEIANPLYRKYYGQAQTSAIKGIRKLPGLKPLGR